MFNCKTSVSCESVRRATYKVNKELRELGLMKPGSLLDQIPVLWVSTFTFKNLFANLHGYQGYFDPNEGRIIIPENYYAILVGYGKKVLTETLRHEYGHALEYCYPEFFHDKRFVGAFGGDYGLVKVPWEVSDCISEYAMSSTQEDFAETFMYYVLWKGEFPSYPNSKAFKRKWKAIKGICEDIAKIVVEED